MSKCQLETNCNFKFEKFPPKTPAVKFIFSQPNIVKTKGGVKLGQGEWQVMKKRNGRNDNDQKEIKNSQHQ